MRGTWSATDPRVVRYSRYVSSDIGYRLASSARPRNFLRGSRENHDSLTKTRQQNLHSKMNEEIEREQEEAKMEVFFFFQMRCLGRGLRVIKLHAVTVEFVED